ncbi:MAG: hypothetical protein FWE28_04330 [Oscillospiraceae bacterium]|nr:hypothetical protein [Oscillospiraceae bacterium]
MKRIILLLAAVMFLFAFAGCRAEGPREPHVTPAPVATEPPETTDTDTQEEPLPETPAFMSFTGTITEISPFYGGTEDTVLVNVANETTSTNFIVGPETVLVMDGELEVGAEVTGFYDTSLLTAMIYPPQLGAVALTDRDHGVMVDRFDEALVSYDGTLQINLGEDTVILLQDGTAFYEPSAETLAHRAMVVVYDISTRSIPAQTTPETVIVLFERAEHPMLFLTEEELAGLEYPGDHVEQ